MFLNERLINELYKLNKTALSRDGKEITTRCMYCGDSLNPNSAHLGIKLPQGDRVGVFHCFKCNASGVLTHNKLTEWGLNSDTNLLIDLAKFNKSVFKLPKNNIYLGESVVNVDNSFVTKDKLSELKLKYINNRIGTNIGFGDLLSKKIVLNIKDLLSSNNINKITRHKSIIDELDNNFIGFLSQDNNFINLRNLNQGKVSSSIDKRYINYNIFGKLDNTKRYYTIPTDIDLLNPKRIRLNIAEGVFDILSVYYNLMDRNEDNIIYSSILGSGYMNICQHFINTLKLINIEIHIYIDNDVKQYKITQLKDMLKPFDIPMYIHRNIYEGEKDFGVPKERINEVVHRIV